MIGTLNRMKSVKAQRVTSLCLCTVAGLALLSFAAPSFAQSQDTLNRIKRMENDIDTLSRAVYKGEKPPASAGAGTDDATANLEVRLNKIEADMRDLTGKIEQQGHENQELRQKVDALSQELQTRIGAVEAGQTNPAATAGAIPANGQPTQGLGQPMPDTNTIPPSTVDGTPAMLQPDAAASANAAENVTGNETGATDAAGLYEDGFAKIKAQDYPGAEKSFTAFMKKYPTHALAPNALYWLGETYYARKDYDKASRTFAEAYQKYPKGPKGADNLLKLGLSLAAKGEKQNACIALGQLKKEYPTGPEPVLKRGDDEMATLGCK